MKDTYFWRILSVAAVAGLFYVGHGLHSGGEPSLDFASTVHAQGAGITYNSQDNSVIMATASDDGKTLYIFSRRPGNIKPVYLGKAEADD